MMDAHTGNILKKLRRLMPQIARLRVAVASVGTILLTAVVMSVPSQPVQAGQPMTIYAGREKPQPREDRYPHYRVLNQSAGYGYSGYGRPQADVNINMRYQAPSTTIINNNVQVIPPSVPVGSISYSQDTYYINNGAVYPNNHPHPHRRYVNNQWSEDEDTPAKPAQDRSRQLTTDVGVTLP